MNRKAFIRRGAAWVIGAAVSAPAAFASNGEHIRYMDMPPSIETVEIGGIKIHGIMTGLVKVKRSHRNQSLGISAIIVDPSWTEWMPIYTWLIEHPEGLILVDTGENAQVSDKNYFKCDRINGFVYRTILRFKVKRNQELPAQLKKLGFSTDDIRWVVLTHLHLDHVDGVQFFPNSEFLLSSVERRQPTGNVPCLLPSWFAPRTIDYETISLAGFDKGYYLTQAKDVVLLPTPGHTYGHQSVLFLNNDRHVLFAGDVTFDQEQLLKDKVAGISADKKAARDTLKRIRTLGADAPLIYLPSHDPESATRLAQSNSLTV